MLTTFSRHFYWIISSSENKRVKTATERNTVREKLRQTNDILFSIGRQEQKAGRILPGTFLTIVKWSLQKLRIHFHNVTKVWEWYHKNAVRKERPDGHRNLVKISDTAKNIGWNIQSISSGNCHQVFRQLRSLIWKRRTKYNERETLKSRMDP